MGDHDRILAAAQYYLSLGWALFPVQGKVPVTAAGVRDASKDAAQLAAWFATPGRGIAVACGEPSGILVVDLDGADGETSWRKLLSDANETEPRTVIQKTARGRHLFFNWDPNSDIKNSVKKFPGIDTRTTGGYVLLAPSPHPTGPAYKFTAAPWNVPLANIPGWLEAALSSPKRKGLVITGSTGADYLERAKQYTARALNRACGRLAGAPPGGRRPLLNKEAYCVLRFCYAGLMDPQDAIASLTVAALAAGIEPDEVDRIINGAAEAAQRKPELPQLGDDNDGERDDEGADAPGAHEGSDDLREPGASGDGGADGPRVGGDREPEPRGSDGAAPGDGGDRSGDGGGARAGHGQGSGAGDEQRRAADAEAGGGGTPELDLSDTGIAAWIGKEAGHRLAFLPAAKGWRAYNPKTGLWEDERVKGQAAWGEVRTYVQRFTKAAKVMGKDEAKRIIQLRSTRAINDVIRAMTFEPGLSRGVNDFDQHEHLFATPSGVVDLRNGTLNPPAAELLLSRGSPIAYKPDAKAPLWARFLEDVTRGDKDFEAFLQRAVGYTLTGSIKEQVFFFLHGSGGNGKGTFVRAIQRIMGDGFFEKLPESAIVVRRGKEADRERLAADLPGCRFVLADETQRGTLNVAFIKELTGGDTMRARKLYQERDLFFPTAKLWIAGNELPLPPNVDAAIRRRVRRLRFYYDATLKPDGNLDRKLTAENEGILAWAVRGAQEWYAQGLQPPPSILEATNEYLDASDWVGEFCAACLTFGIDKKAAVSDLWATYLGWCKRENIRPRVGHPAGLTNELLSRGTTRYPGHAGKAKMRGVEVKPNLMLPDVRIDDHPDDGIPF